MTPPELWVPLPAGMRAVTPGTALRAGDSLVAPDGVISKSSDLPVPRAPLAGVVISETTARLTSGQVVGAVHLQTESYQRESAPQILPKPFTEQLKAILAATSPERADWLPQLIAAGVSANRPTSPDLIAQLNDTAGVDTVLCTLLDPDPHLGICARLAEDSVHDLVIGALLVARLSDASRLVFVVEPTVPDRARRELGRIANDISRLAISSGLTLTVRAVSYSNHYPSGDPTLLMLRLLQRKLPPGSLPTSRGVVLLDAPASVAVGRVIRHDAPLLSIPMALFDHRAPASHLFRTPVGTPVSHLVKTLAPSDVIPEIRSADILQERRVPPDAVISADDLYLHLLAPQTSRPPDPCIRCGWCIEACPTRVQPAALLEIAQTRQLDRAGKFGLSACIECGLCQYVCPSRLPLLRAIRSIKEAT